MKFPRNARMLRSHFDVAPFAGVFFCLLIFVLLCSLVYTPGTLIELPASNAPQSGIPGPKAFMEVDTNGNYYYENQYVTEARLIKYLQDEVARQKPEPVTLVVAADVKVTTEQWAHLFDVAVRAGIPRMQEAYRPKLYTPPANSAAKP